MTNGHDLPGDFIIGICPYCNKSVKNIERYFEEKLESYVHIDCSKDPNSEWIKKSWAKRKDGKRRK